MFHKHIPEQSWSTADNKTCRRRNLRQFLQKKDDIDCAFWVCAHAIISVSVYVCVWLREVLWPRSSHLTSRHLCLPQLYQHIPALPRQAGSGPAVCQEPGFGPSHRDWLGVCVSMGGGDRGWWKGTCTPHHNSTPWNSNYSSPPPTSPTGNHALSKQAAGVRGKAISTTG